MPALGQRFLDVLRKHLELGTSLAHIRMTEEQKHRTRICMELYNLLKQNPYLNKDEYLKNKYNRTYWEIRHDKECLDFIISVLDAGGKNISRFIVKNTYEKAIKMAHDQGDTKNMISAASKLSDLEKLTEPEQGQDLEESITKLPIVLTQDARKILPGKSYSDSKQMDRLRKKWGVAKDPHQEMVERKAEELLSKEAEEEGESLRCMAGVLNAGKGNFDLSSLDASQLAELQRALNARVMEVEQPDAEEIDDEDDD